MCYVLGSKFSGETLQMACLGEVTCKACYMKKNGETLRFGQKQGRPSRDLLAVCHVEEG